MWFTRKKNYNLIESGVLDNMTDVHSHILWGVDDGAKREQQSIQIISALKNLGVKRIFATPHIMANLPNNTAQSLEKAFAERLVPLSAELDIEVKLATEYMLDEAFIILAKGSSKMLTYDGRHLLVEFSRIAAPLSLNELLFEIKSSGYTPVLAHPERYGEFMSIKDIENLRKQGVKLQMNLLSLAGMYRQPAKELAYTMLEMQMYNYIGTDVHSESMVSGVKTISLTQKNLNNIEVLANNNNMLWQ